MKTTRSFNGDTERYTYDFGACSYANGWAQIDTAQDASYFGNWCNPSTFEIMSYCEGDVTHTQCDNAEEFSAELRRISDWYAQNDKRAAMIDPGLNDAMTKKFEALGLANLLH